MRYDFGLLRQAAPLSIDTKASPAARVFWCVTVAWSHGWLDTDALASWLLGHMTDREVLYCIITHGDMLHTHGVLGGLIHALNDIARNLLQGLMDDESGNIGI